MTGSMTRAAPLAACYLGGALLLSAGCAGGQTFGTLPQACLDKATRELGTPGTNSSGARAPAHPTSAAVDIYGTVGDTPFSRTARRDGSLAGDRLRLGRVEPVRTPDAVCR